MHGLVDHTKEQITWVISCAEAGVVVRTRRPTGTWWTSSAYFVDRAPKNIARLSIVTCIQFCIESSFLVAYHSASYFARFCPNHLAVVPCFMRKAVTGNTACRKAFDLVEPGVDCFPPVLASFPGAEGLIEILSNLKSVDPPAVRTVMAELALVCVPLGHPGKLLVPLQLLHVACRGLTSQPSSDSGPQPVMIVQDLLLLF